MQLSDYTITQQNNFVRYCKTGSEQNIDGTAEGRLHHYRRLVYNVIDDSLRSAFPLTENLLSEDEWQSLVDDFISNHSCKSNAIWRMPFEFYQFMSESSLRLKSKYSHLIDLLLFEWKEIEIYMLEDVIHEPYSDAGSLEKDSLVLNRESALVKLSYPVHLVSPKEITEANRGDYFVLLFRTNYKVEFVDLSAALAWLVEQLYSENKSIAELASEAAEITGLEFDIIKTNFIKFVQSIKNKGFILGFKNKEKVCIQS